MSENCQIQGASTRIAVTKKRLRVHLLPAPPVAPPAARRQRIPGPAAAAAAQSGRREAAAAAAGHPVRGPRRGPAERRGRAQGSTLGNIIDLTGQSDEEEVHLLYVFCRKINSCFTKH